jgi:glycosyltransferase involved in cell wall biosynthesis
MMPEMRVLHAVHGFAPEFRGGVEAYVEAVASAQRARGDDVVVLSGSDRGRAPARLPEDSVSGVPVYRLEGLAPHTERLRDRPDGEALVDGLLRRLRPDVLHVHSWLRLVPNLAAVATSAGIPVVATLHDVAQSCPRIHRLKADLSFCRVPESPGLCTPCVRRDPWETDTEVEDELALRVHFLERERSLLAAVLVPSEAQRVLLEEVGAFPPGVLAVLPVALPHLPVPEVTTARTTPGLDVGHWGNLLPAKGTHLLVAAAASLPASLGIVVHLFGTAPDPEFESALRASAPPDRVVFHGPYVPSDLPRFPFDAAAFPSLAHESHSFTLDEAFSLGLPLVVSDAGALPERVGGRGLVVGAGAVEGLADALRRLAEEPGLLTRLRASRPADSPMPFPEHLSRLDAVYGTACLAGAPALPAVPTARERLLALQRRASRRQDEAVAARAAFDRLQVEATAVVEARDAELRRLYDTDVTLLSRRSVRFALRLSRLLGRG